MWKRILSYAHLAGFTQHEAGVILFLAAAMLAGWVLGAVRSNEDTLSTDVRVALAAQDSIFKLRSETGKAAVIADTENERSESLTVAGGIDRTSGTQGTININRASGTMLETLPGIGPATAKKIIAYRKEHGPFARIDDLINVKSIGPKKLEDIRPFITVE